MHTNTSGIYVSRQLISSTYLNRQVIIDSYLPPVNASFQQASLLLINDGQDLVTMQFNEILEQLYNANTIEPVFCVGIHCSEDRKNEYGTAGIPDYLGRGAKASLYTAFIINELLPFLYKTYSNYFFTQKAFAGFSLGGLSALDIAWRHPGIFSKAGVFSGSFWWRDKAQEDPDFNEDTHRIMHRIIRQGNYNPNLQFFFEVGTLDETADRNNNGIIDAIDDTLALIKALKSKGYPDTGIRYIELKDGRHDVATWARAFPDFLIWGWGR
ncbi:MAG TPA: alpha/beta hydrolase-fold protein [Ferruginibacter sp.]|nr:alpha/beta hydrolase-fold protein [Ferruginibacter sp.]HMP20845.1 alpha/beta hydrolase-fold protein [Ferruginibacter sp.]